MPLTSPTWPLMPPGARLAVVALSLAMFPLSAPAPDPLEQSGVIRAVAAYQHVSPGEAIELLGRQERLNEAASRIQGLLDDSDSAGLWIDQDARHLVVRGTDRRLVGPVPRLGRQARSVRPPP